MGKRKKRDACAPDTVSRTICTSFDKCFINNTRAERVLQAVHVVSAIAKASYEFVKTFVLHEVHTGRELPPLNEAFFTSVFAIVSPPNRTGQLGDTALAMRERMRPVFDNVYAPTFEEEDDATIDRPSFSINSLLQNLRDKFITTYSNNIKLNYESYVQRFVILAYNQPDAGHLLDRTSKDSYQRGIARVTRALMRAERDNVEYAPLILEHLDTIIPRDVDLSTHGEDKATLSYHVCIASKQPLFIASAVRMLHLCGQMSLGEHFTVLPQAASLIPSHVRFTTNALIDMCTQADIAELQLGVTRSDLTSNVKLFSDMVWGLFVNSEKKVFKNFDHSLETDGKGVCISVAPLLTPSRPKEYPPEEYASKTFLRRVSRGEGHEYRVAGLDPGNQDLAMVVGPNEERFRYPQKQRKHETDSNRHRARFEKAKRETLCADGRSVQEVENSLTAYTSKALDIQRWTAYLTARHAVDRLVRPFYLQMRWRVQRWRAKVNGQRSLQKMVNNFKNKIGGPDEVIIAFGDWSHTSLRNQEPTMGKGIRRALRVLGHYHVALTNEYRTSKACSKCMNGDCHRFRRRDPSNPRSLVWGLTRCSTCGELHNRDVNGARNIRTAGIAALLGQERPQHLRRTPPVGGGEQV